VRSVSQKLKFRPVERKFFSYLRDRLPTVDVKAEARSVRRQRWTEYRYFVNGHEVTSGLLIYEDESPLGPYGELLYIPDESQLEAMRREWEEKEREKREREEREKAELRIKHEARLRELLQLFEKYNEENQRYKEMFDPESEIDLLICYLIADNSNERLKNIIREIDSELTTIPIPQREAIVRELKSKACYLDCRQIFKLKVAKFIPIEVSLGQGGKIIGRQRTYRYMLVNEGLLDWKGSLKVLRMFTGKIAIFKCPPPKLSDRFVIATRYVEKPNVILVYEYVRFDLQELLSKREYLKTLEKQLEKK